MHGVVIKTKRYTNRYKTFSPLHLLTVFILVIWSVLLQCCTNDTPSFHVLNQNAVILAFGDSITYGTGAGETESYPTMLAQMTGRKVINSGVPGEISKEGAKRLPQLLNEYAPDLVILIHGGNDILQKRNHNELKNNLSAMISAVKEKNIPLVMLGVPEPGIFLKTADVYKDLAKEHDIPIEAKILSEILSEESLKSDIVHPNAKGYQELATNIFNYLQTLGMIEKITN